MSEFNGPPEPWCLLAENPAARPDYFKLAGSSKESLLEIARRTKGTTTKDALKRLMIEMAAEVGGGINWDARIARLLTECHTFFLVYIKLTEGFFSDEESQEMLRRLAGGVAGIQKDTQAIKANVETTLAHAKSIPAFKQSLHDAMERPYQLAAHLWQISMQIDAKWMPLFKAMVRHHANYTHAAKELSTPGKPYLQGTLWKQWNTHIKPIFAERGGVDIDTVLAARPDRVNKAVVGNEIPKGQD